MTLLIATFVNIGIIEIVFYLAESVISRKQKITGFLTTLILGFIVMSVSFGGTVSILLQSMVGRDNAFQLFEILFLFFNMAYGYIRGLGRIASINKKYGNL